MDDRTRVVLDILEGEQKYLQDLEVLESYRRALLARGVLRLDQIRALFDNLNSLLAFQRRFLAGVESNARLPLDEQRFGVLFTTLEDGFSCYESFCANLSSAIQLVQDENGILLLVADILHPKYELTMFLMKPYGRLFKYPLLLQRLLEKSDPSQPNYDELKEGFASITRVVDKVNQAIWQRQNEMAVIELKDQVEDWKGHDVLQFGELLLKDTFSVIRKGNDWYYHVYLFERIILFCKEVPVKLDKKAKKCLKNIQQNPQISRPIQNGGKRKLNLQLKGRIFMANIICADHVPTPAGSPHEPYLLQARWRGDESEENFSLRCRTEEQLIKWQAAINKAAADATERYRRYRQHIATLSPSQMRRSLSQIPNNTLISEVEEPSNLAGYSLILGIQHPYAFFGYDDDNSSIHSRTLVDEEENYQMPFANTRIIYSHTPPQPQPSNRVRFGRRLFFCR